MRVFAALAAVLLAASAPCALAAPTAVRLGPDRIVLDAPAGFSDSMQLASPRLQELAESQTSPSNKVLLFALTDADLRLFMSGDRPDFRRYLVAATPARLQHEQLSTSQFAGMAGEAIAAMGPLPGAVEPRAFLDGRARGQLHLLAELRRDPLIVSVLQGTRLPPVGDAEREKNPRYLLSTTTLVLVRGKPLSLSVVTQFDGAADTDWIRGITHAWVEQILRLNRAP